jgi:hypothetical protein
VYSQAAGHTHNRVPDVGPRTTRREVPSQCGPRGARSDRAVRCGPFAGYGGYREASSADHADGRRRGVAPAGNGKNTGGRAGRRHGQIGTTRRAGIGDRRARKVIAGPGDAHRGGRVRGAGARRSEDRPGRGSRCPRRQQPRVAGSEEKDPIAFNARGGTEEAHGGWATRRPQCARRKNVGQSRARTRRRGTLDCEGDWPSCGSGEVRIVA